MFTIIAFALSVSVTHCVTLCHTCSNDEECGFGGNDCSRSMQVAAILEPLFGFTIKILFGSKKEECVTAEQYRPAKIEKKD